MYLHNIIEDGCGRICDKQISEAFCHIQKLQVPTSTGCVPDMTLNGNKCWVCTRYDFKWQQVLGVYQI